MLISHTDIENLPANMVRNIANGTATFTTVPSKTELCPVTQEPLRELMIDGISVALADTYTSCAELMIHYANNCHTDEG